jgi:hypothetical protein
MVFKKHLTPIGKGGITKHAGKGASEQVLPSRHALSTLTAGNPADRTMNDYAKQTPMANPNADSPGITGLGAGDWGGDAG